MPVTAKFSRNFYERLGDDIANELVDLVNMVDESYRTELREQNEANFARFDAKLEQRLADLRGDLRSEIAGHVASLRQEMAEQGSALRQEIAALDAKFTERFASFEVMLHREITTHTRWMVGLWAAQMTAFLIVGFAVFQKGP